MVCQITALFLAAAVALGVAKPVDAACNGGLMDNAVTGG